MPTIQIKKILVPVDFTETANAALDEAIELAKLVKASLCLIHVIEYNGYYFSLVPETQSVIPSVLKIERAVKDKLETLSLEIKKDTGLHVEVYVSTGQIHSEIVEFASKNEVDLIVMGTHGASGYKEFFIGSNSQRVVNISQIPVLTIQEGRNKIGFKNILLPIDDALHSREKVNFAVVIAKLFNSKILLYGCMLENREAERRAIEVKLKSVEEILSAHGLSFESTIVHDSNVAKGSLQFANDNDCDMIVVNIGHESNMAGIFNEFFSQQIINYSKIPVLSLRHSEGYFSINTQGYGI